MKKLFFILMTGLTLTVFTTFKQCSATDVWVDHWREENVDLFVMDDTITSNDYGFNVSIKEVRNGRLQKVVNWNFGTGGKSGTWRYSTTSMEQSHDTVVIYQNRIFEFCMKKLNRPYRVVNGYYY